MTTEWVLLSALAVGVFGSGHCLGMCGGIAGAFHAPLGRQSPARAALHLLLYNGGRLISYSLAGAAAGALSFAAGGVIDLGEWSFILRVATGGLIMLIGLHLIFRWQSLRWLEALGRPVWKHLAPLMSRIRPYRAGHTLRWLGLGMLWGWLPCGMVYSMLLIALMSGRAIDGALIMFSFGLGTLPAMLVTGAATARWGRWLNGRYLARGTGVLCLILGIWTAAAPLLPMPGHPQHPLSANQTQCKENE